MNMETLKAILARFQPTRTNTLLPEPVNQPHPDTKRVTKAPILIFLGFSLLILMGLGFTAYSKAQFQLHQSQPLFKPKTSTSEIPDWFAKKQAEGIIAIEADKIPEKSTEAEQVTGALGTAKISSSVSGSEPLEPNSEAYPDPAEVQEQQAEAMPQRTTMSNALNSVTTVFQYSHPATTPTQPEVKNDPTRKDVNSPAIEPDNYLLHTRTPAISPDELKAGTVIPSVMIGGINSTLPGQLIAQVSQNVYDTATGQHLLIPQGTKLVGTYEHQISSGQKRILVSWNRLIYPDASSVNLDSMAGVDASGYSGFMDQADTHFWPTFRHALMLSVISAGVQLSQPRATNGNAYSANQVAAGALGQQMNQVGMNTIGRTMNQPPTLTIRPGYIFNVMLTKDLILPPWTTPLEGQA